MYCKKTIIDFNLYKSVNWYYFFTIFIIAKVHKKYNIISIKFVYIIK